MAFPNHIRKTICEEAHMNAGILAIADAKRWKRVVMAMPDFLDSQLKDADVILLNKIELVGEEELGEIEIGIQSINNTFRIYKISAIVQQGSDFWRNLITDLISGREER